MATTSNIMYIDERDLKDTYPGLSSYDSKIRIYGFTNQESGQGYAATPYLSPNSGLVTSLYRDSHDLGSGEQTIGAAATTLVNEADISVSESEITVDSGSACTTQTYIKIDNEIMYVNNIAGNNLTVLRGRLGTSAATHANDAAVFQHFSPSTDGQWLYDSDNDFLIISASSNPTDNNMETGEDWSTLKTRNMKKASRMVESLLDSRLSREIMKDREGNYPEFIKRATALKACVLLISTQDVENPMIESFNDEFDHIIEGYRSGNIQLPTSVTVDSAQGVLREVSVNANSDLRPVELKGTYLGLGYELLKVFIETDEGGAIGTAKYTVVGRSSTGLKNQTIVDSEVIDGQFQRLTPDLWIRWGGDDVATAICTVGDEYEIEIHGLDIPSTVSQNGSISLTRR